MHRAAHLGNSRLIALMAVFVVMMTGLLWWSFTMVPQVAKKNNNTVACTLEAKICPDGSYVGRGGPTCEFTACPTVTYTTFQDATSGITFEYPAMWNLKPLSVDAISTGTIVDILNPKQQLGSELPTSTVVVSHYNTVNNPALLGGVWAGMRTYSSLADLFTDPHSFNQLTGKTTLGGQMAYEVIVGGIGSNYAIMIERPDGVYELDFPAAWTKADVTEAEQHIITSFKFTLLPK